MLPDSLTAVAPGETYYVEVWASDVGDVNTGLTSVYVDLAFPSGAANAGGITHTHSSHASMFAQARIEIPCFGTTHADHFFGPVPITRPLTQQEVEAAYEANTGQVIIERFAEIDPLEMPAVLVAGHRIESQAHYLSDVLCGAALGIVVATGCLRAGRLPKWFARLEDRWRSSAKRA